MKTNILCVVVLYGNRLHESVSYRAVRSQAGACGADVAFSVHDYSPEADPEAVRSEEVVYRHCPENRGLGTAYNAAAEYASKNGISWLLLLDQDTELSDGFLRAYVDAIGSHPDTEVFVPQVLLPDGDFLSPMRRWKKQRRPLVAGGCYPLGRYAVINSGMCVATQLFLRSGGYNEKVWLDFSDTQFVRRLVRAGTSRFYLLTCACTQNFSSEERDRSALKRRYEIYLDCARNCEFIDWSDCLFRLQSVLSHTLMLTFRTHDAYFLRKFFFNYILRK